jgi:hypothetical protein
MANDWIKRPLPNLDLYLAHAFIRHPEVWAELASRGADQAAAEAAYHRIRSRDTHKVYDRTLATYTDWFGPPASTREDTYLWSLALWPDHQWRCNQLDVRQIVWTHGIELRTPRQLARITSLSLTAASNVLRVGYDTLHEVESALGDPDVSEGGWSPQDDLLYDLPDGSVLHCVLEHRILVQLELLTERPNWA